jgi:hypothetical protein
MAKTMKTPAITAPHKGHDAWLLGFATVALVLELALLFHQLRLLPLTFLSMQNTLGRSPIGNLVRKAHSVQDRAPGSLSWYPLAPGDAVSQNDTVMTGASSTAVIEMKEGGEVALEPFTLVRFNQAAGQSTDRLALEINRGSIKVRSQKTEMRLAFRDGSVHVRPQSEIVVMSTGEKAESTLEVTLGAATVERAGKIVALTPGQAVAMTQAPAPPAVLTRFIARNVLPASGHQAFFTGAKAQVTFTWDGDADAQIEWDASPEMAASHLVVASANRASVAFSAGKYYWRLTKNGVRSNVQDFTVLQEAKYVVNTGMSLSKAKEGMEIPLRWAPVPDAEGYLFELSRNDTFTQIEKTQQLKQPETTLAPLGKGKFFWRVQAQNSTLGNWPFSPAYDLQIKKRMEAPKLRGAKHLHLKKSGEQREPASVKGKRGSITKWHLWGRLAAWILPEARAAEVEKIWFEFLWDPTPGAKAYRLEISTQRGFKKVISASEGTKTSAALQLPDHDKYYWRVAAIDEDGDLGEFSSPRSVTRDAQIKVPEAPREVAQIPPPPIVPAKVLEKVNAEPQEPARKRSFHTWAGYGGTYVNQNLTGGNYVMQSSGLPVNRIVAGFTHDFARTTLEIDAWFQPLVYKNALSAAISAPQFGADIFWSRLALRHSFPLGIGVRVRTENYNAAVADSGVTLNSTVFTGLLVGTTWTVDGRWPWSATAALEAGFFGTRTGYGLIWRNRVGIPCQIGSLRPSIELLFHPQYRSVTLVGTREFNFEVSAALVLEWEKSLPILSVRPN